MFLCVWCMKCFSKWIASALSAVQTQRGRWCKHPRAEPEFLMYPRQPLTSLEALFAKIMLDCTVCPCSLPNNTHVSLGMKSCNIYTGREKIILCLWISTSWVIKTPRATVEGKGNIASSGENGKHNADFLFVLFLLALLWTVLLALPFPTAKTWISYQAVFLENYQNDFLKRIQIPAGYDLGKDCAS